MLTSKALHTGMFEDEAELRMQHKTAITKTNFIEVTGVRGVAWVDCDPQSGANLDKTFLCWLESWSFSVSSEMRSSGVGRGWVGGGGLDCLCCYSTPRRGDES